MPISIPSVPASIPTEVGTPQSVGFMVGANSYLAYLRGIQGSGKKVRWLDEYGDISDPSATSKPLMACQLCCPPLLLIIVQLCPPKAL
jgi:hypothetical protein